MCAASQLLDFVAREFLGVAYDKDGEAALQGTVVASTEEEIARLLVAQRYVHECSSE